MKQIPLTRGKITLVDDADYKVLNKHKWYARKIGNTFYASRGTWINRKVGVVYMHRDILSCVAAGLHCDHIDGDGLNNQRINLRIVTPRQNQQNQHVRKTSRFPGVSICTKDGRWQAHIRYDGKRKNLGFYKDEFVAFQTYVVATVVLAGD
jgi:hypothetical protein